VKNLAKVFLKDLKGFKKNARRGGRGEASSAAVRRYVIRAKKRPPKGGDKNERAAEFNDWTR
jgi:hypothetical protein